MQEPPNEGPDDWYFEESLQRWLRHSGRARMRRRLDESAAWHAANPGKAAREFYARLGIDPEQAAVLQSRGRAYIDRQIDQVRSRERGAQFLAQFGIPVTLETL